MNEYKGIINNSIINSYSEVLVIDIMDDKLYRYLVKNNGISFSNEMSYMEYLNTCKDFIYEDDIDKYVESLSISRLYIFTLILVLWVSRLFKIFITSLRRMTLLSS